MEDSQTNIPPICPGGGPLGWGPWPGGGPCIGGGWLWGGKPGPGWWCGMPRGNIKNKVTCQILVTQSRTLQYDMPDSWTAFSPNLFQDFNPLALTSVQCTFINSSHLAVHRAPYSVHVRYLKFRAPLSWSVVGIWSPIIHGLNEGNELW